MTVRCRLSGSYLESVGFTRKGSSFFKRVDGKTVRLTKLRDGTFNVPEEIADLMYVNVAR